MDNYEEMDGDTRMGNLLGNLLGDFLGAVIIIGVTAVGVWGTWNLTIVQIMAVDPMKYYQAIMLICGWRCLTYKNSK
jgi:uncharacterized membrane protein